MRIIVAMDIIGGKCVRLTRGDFDTKKVYNVDPIEVAKEMEDNGIGYLHMVDLDGARNRKPVNLDILDSVSKKTKLKIDFGGGIRSSGDIRSVFSAGAQQVTAGSIAANNPKLFLIWLKEFGPDRIILGADGSGGKISTNAWSEVVSDSDIVTFVTNYRQTGVKYCICTDIDKDGMLEGPSTELYREILRKSDISLIASGGITSMSDIEELKSIGCKGAIIGKAVYEGRLTLKQLGESC